MLTQSKGEGRKTAKKSRPKAVWVRRSFPQEAAEKYPPVPDLPPDQSVYGQESLVEFRDRAEKMLAKILAEAANDETVAVVTHGGTIDQLYHAFLKLPVKDGMFFSTADTGIHEWIVEPTERRVARANYDAHTKGI